MKNYGKLEDISDESIFYAPCKRFFLKDHLRKSFPATESNELVTYDLCKSTITFEDDESLEYCLYYEPDPDGIGGTTDMYSRLGFALKNGLAEDEQVLAIMFNPSADRKNRSLDEKFEFCGYDVIERGNFWISALLNFDYEGKQEGFLERLGKYGLLTNLSDAIEFKKNEDAVVIKKTAEERKHWHWPVMIMEVWRMTGPYEKTGTR